MAEEAKFETWAIVEIMGHSRFAGYVSEQQVGGTSFVRIDVPEVPGRDGYDTRPAFTKLFGSSAIFSMTPTTEETARRAAESFRVRACQLFELPGLRLPAPSDDDPDFDED